MRLLYTASVFAIGTAALVASPSAGQLSTGGPAAPPESEALETIIVTAQKREENVQKAALSITALSGTNIEKQKILSLADLASSITGISFTSNSPQSNEINIRGVVNTRLSAPTADQSVSTFVDDVYVSRSGNLNSAFYDLARIEVLRGPQGVLLGKNVAGGAINILSAPPSFDTSARISLTYGNYDLKQTSGYATGAISDTLAARFSFQTINHAGYARDIVHNVDLENLDSVQFRGQLLYKPKESDLRVSLIVDYSKDTSNGINRVGVPDPVLTGTRPWSTGRALIAALRPGGLSVRESLPVWPTFAGDASPSPQYVRHKNASYILHVEKDVADNIRLTSISGYRDGRAYTLYDQTGLGPTNPYNIITTLLFAEPVNFIEEDHQFSQEVRLTSTYPDSRLDWIIGAYYLHNKVHQFNRFWGETPFQPGGRPPFVLAALSGESHWDDHGLNQDIAGFAQVGFKITPRLKLEAGVRYTYDKKDGTQTGTVIATGDRFVPTDPTPLTPLTANPGFTTPYGKHWSRTTPQATLTWTPVDDILAYATISTGFKGGGFQNDAPNAFAAQTPYNPETVTNYEAGVKTEFLEHRVRINAAFFYEKYKNLQVQQTSAACLCNIINNASSATIKGIEGEVQIVPASWLRIFGTGDVLDSRYDQFIDTNKNNNTGHFLQRTPTWQGSIGAEMTTSLGNWDRAFSARMTYRYQGKMYWSPDNLNSEKPYGLLDARVSLKLPKRDWTVSVYGRNITDKLYRTNIIAFFGDQVSTYAPPRTYGIELSAGF